MTASTKTTAPGTRTAPSAPLDLPRPSLARLTGVELRKLTDTRAGYWLLIIIGLIAAIIVAVQLIVGDVDVSRFQDFFLPSLFPIGFLLPVLGILLVTSEWSQRTTLTTFALVPRRSRVLTAKLAAGLVAALASVVASLLVATIATLIAGVISDGGSWSIDAALIGNAAVFQVANVVMGVGFGMLFLNTPLAIVLSFALPIAWSILGSLITALNKVSEWLDFSTTSEPLLTGDVTSGQWARFGVSVLLWVAVPVIGGLVRVTRREIS